MVVRDGKKALVQCKQWKAWRVGVKEVRELYGVLVHEGADAASLVTGGRFTQEARAFAVGKPLILLDGDALLRMLNGAEFPAATLRATNACPPGRPDYLPALR